MLGATTAFIAGCSGTPPLPDAILVLGASGFIGRALVQALAAEGTPVIAVSRGRPDVPHHPLAETVQLPEATEEGLVELVARSRAVVHLATTSTPGTSAARPLNEVDTNLRLTATLLQALQSRPGVELLYLSSGGSLYTEVHNGPARETARVRPRSYHGAAKLAAEAFISAWCDQFGSRATILRPSNVYGPGQPERPGFGIIPAALGKTLRGEQLQIWGDGSARRDYIYVDDLTRLCSAVLARPMREGATVLNACSGESTSLNTLLDTIGAVTGRPLSRDYRPTRSIDAPAVKMDPGEAFALYGWRHATPLPAGIAAAWRWYIGAAGRASP